MLTGYKHYLRKDVDDNVIHVFSNAFESPEGGDILYKETSERHFRLELKDENGFWKYKYDDQEVDVIVAKTEGEIYDATNLATYKTNSIEKMRKISYSRLSSTDWKAIRHRDQVDNSESTSLTTQEYEDLLDDRKAIRDYCNARESAINSAVNKAGVDAVVWDDEEI